jgi:hypothetical protein
MPAETVHIALELEIPLTVVHALVKQHLLASLTTNGNGHAAPHGHQQPEKEDPAPAPASSAGAP